MASLGAALCGSFRYGLAGVISHGSKVRGVQRQARLVEARWGEEIHGAAGMVIFVKAG